VSLAAKLFGHQPGEDHHCAHSDRGKKAEAYERCAKQREFEATNQRRHRRISDKAPIEVMGIIERLQFIAVKSILAVAEHVKKHAGSSQQKQHAKV
jgi:hypothetical protein